MFYLVFDENNWGESMQTKDGAVQKENAKIKRFGKCNFPSYRRTNLPSDK